MRELPGRARELGALWRSVHLGTDNHADSVTDHREPNIRPDSKPVG